ncbi:lactoylglutathione lyase [Natronospirillum operosum]|uniref:lactoylglutathione lyase n=1 Tax=Natronospirillum operosum TaxID=2759953 RepID=A0A4Z0W709_9GAMM|nr:lactoylglutathione lyase [Natronospirillum operosum]TGG92342.1 lactoylglutathione lyase [Natronospirillum operosum]
MSRHFESTPGLNENRDPATEGFVFNQTMLRIKDPERTLDFYTRVMGMTLVRKLDFPDMQFTLFFLAAIDSKDLKQWSDNADQRLVQTFSRPALLELTHNWGTENDPDVAYHNGNNEPKGFGHIGFAVPELDAACHRFEELGVPFVKRPQDGKMNDIAFIKDPDGYWIEIFEPGRLPAGLKQHLAN